MFVGEGGYPKSYECEVFGPLKLSYCDTNSVRRCLFFAAHGETVFDD